MNIKVRKTSWQDYQFCYRLTKRNMQDYFIKHWGKWNPKVFRQNFNPKETKIITKNNRRMGYFALKIKTKFCYLDNLQLSTSIQNKGLGTKLMSLIETQTRKSKKKIIKLTVFKDNPAKKLYDRLGYKITRNNNDNSVLMSKKV